MTTRAITPKMLPYRRQGEIDYARLEFAPDVKELPPDQMEQSREIREITGLFAAAFTDFDRRPDVFLDDQTFICYDPANLNIRVSPDIYLAFGVDARAIRPRKLYLPWEVGKPPDFALEVASESTAQVDVRRKPDIYARIGIPEYWRFDPGGRYYRERLWGGRLFNGSYQSIELTTEPDGILKGYSAILGLSLCWDDGWPRLYDPATGTYHENWRQERAARQTAEAERDNILSERDAARAGWDAERAERLAAEAEIARLRDELRGLQS